jgi:PAS domain S-box-containing protein
MFSHEDTNPGATEHARTEAEAAHVGAPANSERRLRLAFEQCTTGTILVDLENKVLEVNDTFCEMVGRGKEELVGERSELFTYPEDLSITAEAHHRLTSGEVDKLSYTKRFLHKNGRVVVAEVSKSAVRDAMGPTLCFVASVRDVTKERAISAQLSHQALHDSLTGLCSRTGSLWRTQGQHGEAGGTP